MASVCNYGFANKIHFEWKQMHPSHFPALIHLLNSYKSSNISTGTLNAFFHKQIMQFSKLKQFYHLFGNAKMLFTFSKYFPVIIILHSFIHLPYFVNFIKKNYMNWLHQFSSKFIDFVLFFLRHEVYECNIWCEVWILCIIIHEALIAFAKCKITK